MLEKGTVVFGNWTVESEIGSGAFGTVYKIRREDFGEEYTAAMKVIRIPQDKDDKKRLYSEGMSDEDISVYYKQIAGDFIKEIKLLSTLDGVTNIVDYKDHVIEPNEDFGYTIYIKMQLLTPISQLLVGDGNKAKFLNNEEILKLGKDICSALEVCERKRIIHRDIKIDNIFISEDGDYKLGDFGIARQLEATQGEMSKKGTLMYMAPEVFKGEKYDKTADIYSLGIVLYRLLNKNRAPFFPDYPQPIKFTDKEQANNRRLNGEGVPLINGLSDELNAILRKGCAYNPRDRYQSASEFKAALEGVGETIIVPTASAIEDEKTELAYAEATVIASAFDNVADEATVGIFDTTLAKEHEVVEQTEAVFKETPVAEPVLSDTFFEKETVTLAESEEEEKTQSAFPVTTSTHEASEESDRVTKIIPQTRNKKLIAIIIVLVLFLGVLIGLNIYGNKDVTPLPPPSRTFLEKETIYDFNQGLSDTRINSDEMTIPESIEETSFDIPTTIAGTNKNDGESMICGSNGGIYKVVIQNDPLIIRLTPSTSSSAIDGIAKGSEIEILGVYTDSNGDSFGFVIIGGSSGWVNMKYTEFVSASTNKTVHGIGKYVVNSYYGALSIRRRPDDSNLGSAIPDGTEVNILSVCQGNTCEWGLVEYNGEVGWIPFTFLE